MFGFFLQENSVMRRLGGVSARFDQNESNAHSVLMYLLLGLLCVFLVLVLKRAMLFHRWQKFTGKAGLGLNKKELSRWWQLLKSAEKKQFERIFETRDRFCGQLERLINSDEKAVARAAHRAWLTQDPVARQPEPGHINFVQTEGVKVMDFEGELIMEGFIKHASPDAVTVLALSGKPFDIVQNSLRLQIERAGREMIMARAFKGSNQGDQWTLAIGQAADQDHQREEYRIQVGEMGLVLEDPLKMEAIREEFFSTDRGGHHLLNKSEKKDKQYEDLILAARGFFLCRLFQFEDLSALGIRIHFDQIQKDIIRGQCLHFYFPLLINGVLEDQLVCGRIEEVWQKPVGQNRDPIQVARVKFVDLSAKELSRMRRLVNLVGQHVGTDKVQSKAEEIYRDHHKSEKVDPIGVL